MSKDKEILPMDKAEEACVYVLVKISVDEFEGENPSQEELKRYAFQFAKDASFRVMTASALICHDAAVLDNFVWYDTEEEARANRR